MGSSVDGGGPKGGTGHVRDNRYRFLALCVCRSPLPNWSSAMHRIAAFLLASFMIALSALSSLANNEVLPEKWKVEVVWDLSERDEKLSIEYLIPDHCERFNSDLESYGWPLSNLWTIPLISVSGECDFWQKYNSGNNSPKNDFISRFDFWNIPLSMLPATSLFSPCFECEEEDGSDMSILEQALPTKEERKKYKEMVSRKDGVNIQGFEFVNDECRLKDGEFVGVAHVHELRLWVYCSRLASAIIEPEGIDLRYFGYTDFNHDDYMDVILLFKQRHGGRLWQEEVVVLTRLYGENEIVIRGELETFTRIDMNEASETADEP